MPADPVVEEAAYPEAAAAVQEIEPQSASGLETAAEFQAVDPVLVAEVAEPVNEGGSDDADAFADATGSLGEVTVEATIQDEEILTAEAVVDAGSVEVDAASEVQDMAWEAPRLERPDAAAAVEAPPEELPQAGAVIEAEVIVPWEEPRLELIAAAEWAAVDMDVDNEPLVGETVPVSFDHGTGESAVVPRPLVSVGSELEALVDATDAQQHAVATLEGVLRQLKRGELVVPAGRGASAESVLASILAALLQDSR